MNYYRLSDEQQRYVQNRISEFLYDENGTSTYDDVCDFIDDCEQQQAWSHELSFYNRMLAQAARV